MMRWCLIALLLLALIPERFGHAASDRLAVAPVEAEGASETVSQILWEACDRLERATLGQKVHKAVQKRFKAEFGDRARVEVKNPGGRADMVLEVRRGRKEVYELKPIRNAPMNPAWNRRAKAQRNRYVRNIPDAVEEAREWAVPRSIENPFDPHEEIVLVTYPTDPGMIYYHLRKKEPEEQPERQSQASTQGSLSTDRTPVYLAPPVGLGGGHRSMDLLTPGDAY